MTSPRHDKGRSQTRICGVCGDEIGLREDGEVFVACYDCGFPVCRPCYEYERSDGHQCCPQCNRRYKRHKGCPRVAGDEEENGDGDDFENEFQINTNNKKEYPDHDQHDSHHQKNAFAPSENGDYNPQQWHPNGPAFSSIAGSVVGKDFEGEKDMNNVEWKERVEKWKAKQEKRGLVSKDDGANDQGGEEDDYLYA